MVCCNTSGLKPNVTKRITATHPYTHPSTHSPVRQPTHQPTHSPINLSTHSPHPTKISNLDKTSEKVDLNPRFRPPNSRVERSTADPKLGYLPHPEDQLAAHDARRIWSRRLFFRRGYRGQMYGRAMARSRGPERWGAAREQPVLKTCIKPKSAAQIPNDTAIITTRRYYTIMMGSVTRNLIPSIRRFAPPPLTPSRRRTRSTGVHALRP